MPRQPKTLQDAVKLVQLIELISSTSRTLLDEWAKESADSNGDRIDDAASPLSQSLPSRSLYQAQRTLLAAAGVLTELVSEPSNRLLEVSSSYFESRALHIAAEKRVPDLLAGKEGGVEIGVLAEKTGIEGRKLCKVFVVHSCVAGSGASNADAISSVVAMSLLDPSAQRSAAGLLCE